MNFRALQDNVPQTGKLEWIGLRAAHRGEVRSVAVAEVVEGLGIQGDHRAERDSGSKRQITLVQAEHLPVIAALSGQGEIDPALLRRNLLVSGVNLLALKDRRFTVGEVVLEGSGPCHPCSRMEEALGPGGYSAMRGHGGITARVVKGGVIHLGDPVRLVSDSG
jgi:MOSC domain-containing protein YiiM